MSVAELRILDEIGRCGHVSQRELAERVGLALGAVNRHLGKLLGAGYIQVLDRQVRPFAYRLTGEGQRHREMLRHRHYKGALQEFRMVEDRIRDRLAALAQTGVRRVVFYGAGELMEVAGRVGRMLGLEVAGVVDDDVAKHGLIIDGHAVAPPDAIAGFSPDAVVITTIRYAHAIRVRLEEAGRPVRIWEL